MKKLIFIIAALILAQGTMAQKLEDLQRQAQSGDPHAMLRVAHRYEHGIEVKLDSAEALRWIQQAIALDYADAYARIATYYVAGKYLPKDDAKAFEMLRTAAEKGSVLGVARMGRFYENGIGVAKDTVRALQLYQQAADRGGSRGLYYMASCYFWGSNGVQKDYEKALMLAQQSLGEDEVFGYEIITQYYDVMGQYKKAAKSAYEGMRNGLPECAAMYASYMFEGKGLKENEAEAIRILEEFNGAYPGEVAYTLGSFYANATDENLKDITKAKTCYEQALSQGHPYAALALGGLYMSQKDTLEAEKYYRRATEMEGGQYFWLGDLYLEDATDTNDAEGLELLNKGVLNHETYAANMLGTVYLYGTVVEQDIPRAAELLEKSTEWGLPEYCLLGRIYMESDPQKAQQYFQKALKAGDTEAYYYLAMIAPDNKSAMKYLERGDKAGDRNCASMLGKVYEYGLGGVKVDNKKAEKYYLKAGDDSFALYRLGVMWLNGDLGKGTDEDYQKGIAYLEQAAEQGYIDAIYSLGILYQSGDPIGKVDYAKARQYFELLADNDIAVGQYELGYMYENGMGVPVDSVMVLHYYTLASQNGNADAMCYLGDYYRDGRYVGGRNCERAAELFHQAAEMGDDGGCYYMGRSYLEGCGVVQDTSLAFPWLWKAAAMKEANAMAALADIYNNEHSPYANPDSNLYYYVQAANNGHGRSARMVGKYLLHAGQFGTATDYLYKGAVARDDSAMVALADCMLQGIGFKEPDAQAAYSVYHAASTYGNAEAYSRMGQMLLYGVGIDSDEALGKSYLDTAARSGNAVAMRVLSQCYANGWGCSPDSAIALNWIQKAAEANDIAAINQYAEMCASGEGAPKDEAKAFQLYSKGHELGSTTSYLGMGQCYEEGIGVTLNSQKAFEIYTEVANADVAQGWVMLGLCYVNGIYVEENMESAFSCFQKAADLGSARGAYNVGLMYEKGDGVKADKKQAKKYYKLAAEAGLEAAQAALNRL